MTEKPLPCPFCGVAVKIYDCGGFPCIRHPHTGCICEDMKEISVEAWNYRASGGQDMGNEQTSDLLEKLSNKVGYMEELCKSLPPYSALIQSCKDRLTALEDDLCERVDHLKTWSLTHSANDQIVIDEVRERLDAMEARVGGSLPTQEPEPDRRFTREQLVAQRQAAIQHGAELQKQLAGEQAMLDWVLHNCLDQNQLIRTRSAISAAMAAEMKEG